MHSVSNWIFVIKQKPIFVNQLSFTLPYLWPVPLSFLWELAVTYNLCKHAQCIVFLFYYTSGKADIFRKYCSYNLLFQPYTNWFAVVFSIQSSTYCRMCCLARQYFLDLLTPLNVGSIIQQEALIQIQLPQPD